MKLTSLLTVIGLSLYALPLLAEESHEHHHPPPASHGTDHSQMDHSQMDHSQMDHGEMDHGEMDHGEMDHSEMDHSQMDHGEMDHSQMDHSQMDHGAMDSVPQKGGLRDPHAYSSGYTLHSGPYVLEDAKHMHAGDTANFHALAFDRLEVLSADGDSHGALEGGFWFGNTYDRFVIKTEGEIEDGQIEASETKFLWRHAISAFWDLDAGVRIDSGVGSDNSWLTLGLSGLMPYWIETDVALQLREDGLVGLSGEFEYDLHFSNRLIAEPGLAFNIYSEDNQQQGLGSGLNDLTLGVRLRYEITRQFAPYIGVEWKGRFGEGKRLARAANQDTHQTSVVAGLRFWF